MESRVTQRHVVRTLTSLFRLCSKDGRRRRRRGGYYDTTAGNKGSPAGGKRRLIREGGGGAYLSGQGLCSAPGSRRGSSVDCSPQRMTIDDVIQTVEQSGGAPQLNPPPPGISTEWTDEIMAEDTSEWESVPMMILEYDRKRAH